MDVIEAYPLPSKDQLKSKFVGKRLHDLPVPSAILDIAKLKKNCSLMLEAMRQLDVSFRAHVKTHKTSELSQMQLGEDCKDARLICSTLAELEQLIPLLQSYKQKGVAVNVLYGVPPGCSHISRLARFLKTMGPGSLTLMIDSPAQLVTVSEVYNRSGTSMVKVFLKTDSGYHRAGLPPTSNRMQDLVNAALELEVSGLLQVTGFYSHNSLSYGGNSPLEAMDNLRIEVDACTEAALTNTPKDYISSRNVPLYMSCGASPTALSLQNLLSSNQDTSASSSAKALRTSLAKAKEANIQFEIHAGVYPTLDMQQVAACSRELGARPEDNIAFTILAEICSSYPDRTEFPEALINAGVLLSLGSLANRIVVMESSHPGICWQRTIPTR